ncbi:hypothetical protein GCM10009087_17520 [Sphingomonas oligophenolica]
MTGIIATTSATTIAMTAATIATIVVTGVTIVATGAAIAAIIMAGTAISVAGLNGTIITACASAADAAGRVRRHCPQHPFFSHAGYITEAQRNDSLPRSFRQRNIHGRNS